jgi:hypothetical protein
MIPSSPKSIIFSTSEDRFRPESDIRPIMLSVIPAEVLFRVGIRKSAHAVLSR